MSKILSVFGATGNQGGSVINSILADPVLSKEFKVRGITRDATKPAAKALTERGVEVVTADMSSQEAAAPAVKDAHTVFLVTNFWESASAEVELAQGKAVTDAAKAAGVKHIIFSSLINVTEASKGKLAHVSHFDAKSEIEKYIRQSGVPCTFVLPGFFASNFFGMINKGEDGTFAWNMPTEGSKTQVPIFDANSDMGKFVKAAIKHFPSTNGKQIYAASEYITGDELVAQFSEAIGKPARFQQVPGDAFKSFLPPAIAQEMYENMLLLQEPGYYGGAELAQSLALLDEKPVSFRAFVEANKAKWE